MISTIYLMSSLIQIYSGLPLDDDESRRRCVVSPFDSLSIPQNDKSPTRAATIKLQQQNYLQVNRTVNKSGGIAGKLGEALAYAEFTELYQAFGGWSSSIALIYYQMINNPNPYAPPIPPVFTSLDQYAMLYQPLPQKPAGLKYDWRSDSFFASNQVMVNPVSIRKTVKLPFVLKSSQVQFVDSFDSLGLSLSEGRLYHVDHSDFEKYRTQVSSTDRYMTSPIALFYRRRNSKTLIPLAIKPISNDSQVYTPKLSTASQWLLAKIMFNVADTHKVAILHFLDCHIGMEPIHTSLLRNMAVNHPIAVLLSPFFRIIHGNNVAGDKILLSSNGTWNQNAALHSSAVYAYMNEKLPSWDFRNAQYDNDVRKRRIEELLGNFPFYDQGSKILGTYINSIDKFLRLYYENDQAVINDKELNDWARESSLYTKGFPSKFRQITNLTSTLAHILYMLTVRHHGMTTENVYNFQTALPFRPVALYNSPKMASNIKSESDIISYLPNLQQSVTQIVFGSAFARPISQDPKDSSLYSLLSATGTKKAPFSTNRSSCVIKKWAADTFKIPRNENSYNVSYWILDADKMPSNVFI